ncbi:MAG: toxin TcdB middle/N-terminal domain-containing protein, partial [Pseudonocardiaceae bacterium]
MASFVDSITQAGYRRRETGGYLKKTMPPLEFGYTKAVIDERLREFDPESLENLPVGVAGSGYQWVDLDGEGISGVLTEQAGAWFYKGGLGEGRLGPMRQVIARPQVAALNAGRQQLVDLAGDGQLDLVDFGGGTPGFYERSSQRHGHGFERSTDEAWSPFKAFPSLPNLDWRDPNLRMVDLTGDGHADVMITEEDVISWYPSLAEDGFGPMERAHPPADEEHGPRLVFAEGEQAIYLADMSGDGLADLVRTRNGEVCYWPSFGYGRFGAKVTMDNAPFFDEPEQFDQRRMRIADIDGSGTTDLIYLHRSSVRVYRNLAGNALGSAYELPFSFPRIENVSQVSAVDLLGNGTACLVWSSPLPSETGRHVRYVDLMGGEKPHLLTEVRNNLGAHTRVQYAPSTKFYLADKAAGRPWITRLPFPVHVVERMEAADRISGNLFASRYAYHHGYFDGIEREFRGFGMVEQWDTESFAALAAGGQASNLDEASHVSPVLTKTWFHTGVFHDAGSMSRQFEAEYFREADHCAARPDELLLADTVLPEEALTPDELRQACRALKGSVLRQEVYALDGTEAAARPYTVSERSYAIRLLQHAAGSQRVGEEPPHAVFFVHPREAIAAHYERKLYPVGRELRADPRVSHQLVLEVDDFGNVLRSASVGYGRRHEDPDPVLTAADHERQRQRHLVYTE